MLWCSAKHCLSSFIYCCHVFTLRIANVFLYWHRIMCCHKATFYCSIGCNTNKLCLGLCADVISHLPEIASQFFLFFISALNWCCNFLQKFKSVLLFFPTRSAQRNVIQAAYCKMCSSVSLQSWSSTCVPHDFP